MTTVRVHLGRAEPDVTDGKRRCAQCGDFIDPIDWCTGCADGTPCGTHRKVRKRADAAFCNAACKALRRDSYIRDCL